MSPEDFSEATQGIDIHRFLQQYPNKFGKYLQENNRVSMVTIRIKGADICAEYFTSGCNGTCQKLHLCKDYISQTCKIFACNFSHDIKTEHNKTILRNLQLINFTHEEIIRIIRLSQPQVCYSYNDLKVCSYQDRCTRLHICADFVQNKCSNNHCDLNHTLVDPHAVMILNVFGFSGRETNILDKIILYPESGKYDNNYDGISERMQSLFQSESDSDSSSDSEDKDYLKSMITFINQSETHQNPTSDHRRNAQNINSDWMNPKYGDSVLWHYYLLDDIPLEFDNYYSTDIEEAYCDPTKSDITITCPTVLLEIYPGERQLIIDFDRMIGIFAIGKMELKILRTRCNLQDDIFYWYYSPVSTKWLPYSDDLQFLIEENYKQMEKRFLFNHQGQQVRIKFEDMTQKDRRTGLQLKIRRRPVFIR